MSDRDALRTALETIAGTLGDLIRYAEGQTEQTAFAYVRVTQLAGMKLVADAALTPQADDPSGPDHGDHPIDGYTYEGCSGCHPLDAAWEALQGAIREEVELADAAMHVPQFEVIFVLYRPIIEAAIRAEKP